MSKPQKVIYEISLLSVIKVIALLLFLWLIYLVKDIIVILIIVGIITVALGPPVKKLAKLGVPRALSIIVLYLALLIGLGFFVYFIAQPVAAQMKSLTLNFPYYASRLSEFNMDQMPTAFSNVLNEAAGKISGSTGTFMGAIFSIFGGVVAAVTVFALTFYFLVDEEGIRKSIVSLIPIAQKENFYRAIKKIGEKLGNWLKSQLILMAVVGVASGIGLWILGIEYALMLGLTAGLLEIIPFVGPIVAGLIAVVIAFMSGAPLWKILAIIVLYLVIQQLENHVLVPKLMQRTIGLSPVIVIISILIGNKLLGIGGVILAVPVAAGIQVLLSEYHHFTKPS